MLKLRENIPANKVDNPRGGTGTITIRPLLEGAELQSGAKAFGRITLPPGAEIGFHQHVDDSEVYYILSGEAYARDDEQTVQLRAGDVLFTDSSHWHSIGNRGNIDVEFIGLILNK